MPLRYIFSPALRQILHRGCVPNQRPWRKGIGRGTGNGKTSGRGHKGAGSRSGWSSRLRAGGQMPLFRRLPKRGFNNAFFATVYVPVNVSQLAVFEAGTEIDLEKYRAAGLIKHKNDKVKILGEGELNIPLTVHAHAFSQSARSKIEAAGGKAVIIPGPKPFRKQRRKKEEKK